ncbi:MAG: hypothetical protein COB16_05795 [Rhodobacteraceae bacterium]|nr:MAG: hypothetical protein COB16_05795 [Paracoccaceae bacterium]
MDGLANKVWLGMEIDASNIALEGNFVCISDIRKLLGITAKAKPHAVSCTGSLISFDPNQMLFN